MSCLARLRQLLAQDPNGATAALHLHRVSLRFKDPAQERGFLQSRLDKLLANLLFCTCASVALCVACLMVLLLLWGWYDRSTFVTSAAYELARIQMIGLAVAGGVAFLVGLATRARWLALRVGPLACEWATVAAMTPVLCLLVLTLTWYSCKLSGQDPQDVWLGTAQHSDATTLLIIDFFVTTSHLVLPIRWIIMVPLEAAGIGLYIACIFIGSPEFAAPANLAILTGLIIAAAVGKRAAELNERMAFSKLAEERVLRCTAEFELSQLRSSELARRGPQSEASVPTTTNTGRIFQLEDGPSMSSQLEEISALGEQEHWLLGTDDVELLPDRVLGKGGFGIVLMGLSCGTPVAVKLVLDRHDRAIARNLSALANELRILRHLRHPNVVCIHGAVVDVEQQLVGLVLEMVQGRTVLDFMGLWPRRQGPPEHGARYQVCLGVSRAFVYLHSRQPPIVHGDLKSSNVLVEARGTGAHPKLLDFGLARVLTRNARPSGGTLSWMAPEVFGGTMQRPLRSADIFSLGMLLHLVATCTHPRVGMSKHTVKRLLRQAQPDSLEWPPDSAFQPHCQPLVVACLQVEEYLRPGAAEVLAAVASWPGLGDLPALVPDLETVPDPSRVKKWSAAVQEISRKAGGSPEQVGGEEPAQPASQHPARAPQQPSRPEMQKEESPTGLRVAAAGPKMLPGMRQTAERRMFVTVVDAVKRWNYEVPPDSCCGWHVGVKILQDIAETLAGLPCEPSRWQMDTPQCRRCGILPRDGVQVSDGYVCEHCSTSNSRPRPTTIGQERRLEKL